MGTAKKAVKKSVKKPKPKAKPVADEKFVTPEVKIAEISKEVSVVEKRAASMTVKTKEDVALATEFVVNVKKRINRIEELRQFFVKPLNEQVKKINTLFKEQSAPLEQIESTIKRSIADYTMEQDRIARKEEARLAALRAAQDARREDKGLAPIAVPLPTVARPEATVKTEGGTMTTVKVWKFEVLNIDLVPRHLLRCEVRHASVQAQIDAGARAIDGLRIYEDIEVRASAR